MTISITSDLFLDHLNCHYKSHLKHSGSTGVLSEFELMQRQLAAQYRNCAAKHICSKYQSDDILHSPASLLTAVEHGYSLLTDVPVTSHNLTVRMDAVARLDQKSSSDPEYCPVLFIRNDKLTKIDKIASCILGACFRTGA